MQFDVFEKLSELETKIHLQKEEMQRKEDKIRHLTDQNNFLLNQLEVNMREIAALRKSQSSEIIETLEKEVQTEWNVVVTESKVVDSAFAGSEASIADILKQTSDAVTSNTGYVFDEQTGLYFDKNSGYYYDSENQLFFEPRSGIYYTYNSETQEYSYHSSVSSEFSEKFKALQEKWSRDGNEKLSSQRKLSSPRRSPSPSERHSPRRRRLRSNSASSEASSYYRYRRRRRGARERDHSSGRHHRHHRRRSRSRSHSRRSYSRSSSSRDRYRHRSRGRRSRDRYRSSSSSSRCHSSRYRDRDAPTNKTNGTCIAATPVVYPPSVRLTVLGSGPNGPAVGSVGVLTSRDASRGLGCLGRDNRFCQHIFDLSQDPELDEIHCEITFNELDQVYHLRDKKALSGTFLNGNKLDGGEKKAIKHGDVLRIGANKLLIHIHPGRETCGQCDSSEIKAAIESEATLAAASTTTEKQSLSPKDAPVTTKNDAVKAKYAYKKKNRRSCPRQRTDVALNDQSQYQDRAAMRRARDKAVSASAQAIVGTAAAAQIGDGLSSMGGASVLTPIDESNVGARLLTKMGWNKGEGLGREKGGIAEPISASMRLDHRAGLGFGVNAVPIDSTPSELRQARALSVTQERYRQIEERERQGQS
ncbi:unnamed protein product [Rodentolepis nana]|uniref:Angiogenic factor with G patch and FHA domains 1 n=1 Tax=Rodentolepis nana TaxID=102285 RepID=A0A0R3T717_RODNA|nr:unnamed protein product [Rodentolepis nana]